VKILAWAEGKLATFNYLVLNYIVFDMKRLIILISFFAFIGCSPREECQYEVAQFDLNAPYDEKIDFTDCGDYIHYYEMDIEGELDGEIMILDYFKFKAQGKIDTLIRGDYYFNKFNFNYKPIGAVEGKLKFKITLI
jgi:hypothetical protein